MIDFVKGAETAKFYLTEIEKINAIKSQRRRYEKMILLANKWANDIDERKNLTDGFNQYISELIWGYIDLYKPVPFKKKLKNFVANMNIYGR